MNKDLAIMESMVNPSRDFGPQMQSDKIGTLALALSKAQSAMTGAVKGSTNPHFKSSYADLTACVAAARLPLAANGLAVIQTVMPLDGKFVLCTTLAHESGEWIRSVYPLNPSKPGPQPLGSEVTYARRYSYCAIIGLAPAGDDDDAESATDRVQQEVISKAVSAIKTALAAEDAPGLLEVWTELNEGEMTYIWREFNSHQKKAIREMLQAAREASNDA